MKKIKKLAALLSGAMLLNSMTCGLGAGALDPKSVLESSLDDLQQTMVDFMMLKQIVMKNVSVSDSASQSFCRQIDYDSNGSIDVFDMIAAKQKILTLSGIDDPYPNWPEVPVSSVTTVQTDEIDIGPVTTTKHKDSGAVQSEPKVSFSSVKEGDVVTFTGTAFARPDGGMPTRVPYGAYKILVILEKNPLYPYTVQLENTGWVSYQELTNEVQQDSVFENPSEPKIGDTVFYSGIAYSNMNGNGKSVVVEPGFHEISNIMSNVNEPYIVQLKDLGWVSYDDVKGKLKNSEPVVTTTVTQTESAVTSASSSAEGKYGFKVGDTVEVNGIVYYSAKGKEPWYEVSKKLVVLEILDENDAPYNVHTNEGWVSFRACKKVENSVSETTPAVTTTVTTTVASTAPVTSSSVTTTSDPFEIRVGDNVRYKGKAYYSASGKGTPVDVDGTYKVEDIIFGKDPYPVLLDKAGWVSYKELTGREMPMAPIIVTTTETTAASVIKIGDKVSYKGKAYYSAAGKGTPVDVNGIYDIIDIREPADNEPYTVLLDKAGWVSYKELTGKDQAEATVSATEATTTSAPVTTVTTTTTTSPVTTASSSVTTTASSSQSSGDIKVGATVRYKGTAYYSSKGTGKTVELSTEKEYVIEQILDDPDVPYTVCLKNAGWVSYKELAEQNSGEKPVSFENRKFRIKNAASGKYLTYDELSNDANVFQYVSGSEKGQVFTFKKYSNTGSYVLYTGDSDKYVLDIVKDPDVSSDDPDFLKKAIKVGCNVDIYENCDPDAQRWIFENIGNDRYKISSAANTKVVLMTYGTDNGSGDGKLFTSLGNVFLSEFENKDYQCWILEEVK